MLVENPSCYYMSLSFEGVLMGAAVVMVGLGKPYSQGQVLLGPLY